ncbi:NUDIX hydrolase [Marinomonas algicola]|uniref:NUDIX hydrolase n=1 Tax=Marinomonas algicola TaxID=2773454 RepID=UPI00174A4859|nr:NUDIX domain-containing protein [Marinomonas algicola]
MRQLKTAFHPDVSPVDVSPLSKQVIIMRHAARGIVLKGEDILLLYTRRYHDYSLPGGGIDGQEDYITGLIRELKEEKIS